MTASLEHTAPLSRYPILFAANDAPFVWQAGSVRSAAELLATAMCAASRLPQRRYMLNLCEDRYEFLVSFVAAQIAGQTCLLPSSRADQALRELVDRYPDSYTLIGTGCAFEGRDVVGFDSLAGPASAPAPIPLVAADHIAAIVFSSGSTGAPTAHTKTWGALWRTAAEIAERFEFAAGPGEAIVGAVPPQHMYGLETTILLPLVTGALVHCGRPLLPADIDEALNAVGAVSGNAARRWLIATPFTLRAMADDPLFAPHLDAIISATMPLEATLASDIEQRWGTSLFEIYGCTEGGSLATRRVTESARWIMLPGVTIAMRADTAWVENGHLTEPVPLADQIAVQSPTTFDLFGRSANLVKVGGKRTSLEALNAALTGLPGVRDGVFFVPDLDRDDRLTAFVVAPDLTTRDIVALLREHIDPVFLPRPIVMVPSLPRNELGKIPRAALVAMATNRRRK